MRRFLVKAKACHEKGFFGRSGRLAYPSQKKYLPEHTTGTVQGDVFARYITYSSQLTSKFRTVFRPELRHSPDFRTTAYRVQRRT